MKFSIFESLKSTSLQEIEVDNLKDIVDVITSAETVSAKTSGKLIKLATFGNVKTESGCLRSNANVLEVHGLELDYDAEVVPMSSMALMLKRLGVRAILYTSFKHSTTSPRYRVLLELSRPFKPSERIDFFNTINSVVGGIFASESAVLSQSYFYQGSSKPTVEYLEGLPLDKVSPESFRVKAKENARYIEAINLAAEHAKKTRNDKSLSRHLAIHCLGCDLGRSEVTEALLPYALDVFEMLMRSTDSSGKKVAMDKEAELKNIQDGFAKGRCDKQGIEAEKDALEYLLGTHFKILKGSKFRVGTPTSDGVRFLQKCDFIDYNHHLKCTVIKNNKAVEIPATKLWIESPRAKMYDKVRFTSDQCSPSEYNLFEGFKYSQSDRPLKACYYDSKKILKHIFFVLCSGNKTWFRYFMAWCADVFLDPGNKKGIGMALLGVEGTGKSIIADMLKSIAGQHSYKASSAKQVVGDFNQHLMKVVLLISEEAVWAGDKASMSKQRDFITSPIKSLEAKGENAVEIDCMIHLLQLSNHIHTIYASPTDRRNFILNVNDKRRGDLNYFSELAAEIANGGEEAFFQILTRVNWRADVRNPPFTEELATQKIYSLNSVETFIYDSLCDEKVTHTLGGIPINYHWVESEQDGVNSRIPKEDMYTAYKESTRDKRFYAGKTEFKNTLAKIFKDLNPSFTGKSKIEKNGMPRMNVYMLTNLSECRKAFAKFVNAPMNVVFKD